MSFQQLLQEYENLTYFLSNSLIIREDSSKKTESEKKLFRNMEVRSEQLYNKLIKTKEFDNLDKDKKDNMSEYYDLCKRKEFSS